MVRRRTGGSGGPIGQLSFLAPPPPAPPARADSPTAAASMLPGDGAAPANLAPTLPAGIPQDAAFDAVSFVGDRRAAAQRLDEAEALFVARHGAPARLLAVSADEYDEYVRLDPRVTPHPRLPVRSVYLLVPSATPGNSQGLSLALAARSRNPRHVAHRLTPHGQ